MVVVRGFGDAAAAAAAVGAVDAGGSTLTTAAGGGVGVGAVCDGALARRVLVADGGAAFAAAVVAPAVLWRRLGVEMSTLTCAPLPLAARAPAACGSACPPPTPRVRGALDAATAELEAGAGVGGGTAMGAAVDSVACCAAMEVEATEVRVFTPTRFTGGAPAAAAVGAGATTAAAIGASLPLVLPVKLSDAFLRGRTAPVVDVAAAVVLTFFTGIINVRTRWTHTKKDNSNSTKHKLILVTIYGTKQRAKE